MPGKEKIKKALIPVSYAYSAFISLRNNLFDKGILRSEKMDVPVISIGNITTGGSGKTPVTLHLARYLLDRGRKVGIVSRGYGRSSKNIEIVFDGKKLTDDVGKTGDELLMISEELSTNYKDFFTVAYHGRVDAVKFLLARFPADIILLDDAFQHRYIKRDADILILDAEDFYANEESYKHTIPYGKLREDVSNIKRADIIIQNNKSGTYEVLPPIKDSGKEYIMLKYKAGKFLGSNGNLLRGFEKKAIVFSGVASPDSFHKMLVKEGIHTAEKVVFPDHHNYIVEDIQRLMKNYDTGKIYITTQKDYVKIKKFENFIKNYPVYYLKLELNFEKNYNILIDMLERFIVPDENRY